MNVLSKCTQLGFALGLLSFFCICNTSCTSEPECECVHEIGSSGDGKINVTLFFRNIETGQFVESEYTISAVEENDCEVWDFTSRGFIAREFESCLGSFYIKARSASCNKSVYFKAD